MNSSKLLEEILMKIDKFGNEKISKQELAYIVESSFNNQPEPSGPIESNGVSLFPENYVCKTDEGVNIALPRKEFKMLYYLMRNSNRVVTRDELLRKVWGTDVIVEQRTVDVHIRKVRSKIGKDCIETKKCYGYMWKEK